MLESLFKGGAKAYNMDLIKQLVEWHDGAK